MKLYIIKMKLHSNSSKHLYWNKDDKGFVHKESKLTLLTKEQVEWFKNSCYYDEKNKMIIATRD